MLETACVLLQEAHIHAPVARFGGPSLLEGKEVVTGCNAQAE